LLWIASQTQNRIPDPEAVKPDDWDESEPEEIPDPEAVKPDDWLDHEPKFIPDPNASKPEDWDDEFDGVWEHPKVCLFHSFAPSPFFSSFFRSSFLLF